MGARMSEQKQTAIEITDKSVRVNAYGNVTEEQTAFIESYIGLAIASDKRFILRLHGCDRSISGNLFIALDEQIKQYHKNHYARYSPKTGVLFKVDKIKPVEKDARNEQ